MKSRIQHVEYNTHKAVAHQFVGTLTLRVLIIMMAMPSVLSTCFIATRSRTMFHQDQLSDTRPSYFAMTYDQHSETGGSRNIITQNTNQSNRRSFILEPLSISILASILTINNPTASNAACLPGDIRSECIGVYKMPLDDAVLKYVETPEQLKKFAPDLNWVPPIEYPKTYSAAITQIQQQRAQLDVAAEFLSKGDLNQCGLILLDVTPKLSSAGKIVLKRLDNALNKERNLEMKRTGNADATEKTTSLDMKAYRFEYAMNEVLGYLGESDILIGQGISGQLGVSAPAQIQILSSLDEATREFDELLRAIPEKI